MNGRIVLPEDSRALVQQVQMTWFCKRGPRFTRTVGLILQKVCEMFRVDPETLADSVSGHLYHLRDGTQLAFVGHPCLWSYDGKSKPTECDKFFHARSWESNEKIDHYKVLIFKGSAIEVAQRLRKWFEPVTSGKPSSEGIALPDLGDLEGRVGLTEFTRGL